MHRILRLSMHRVMSQESSSSSTPSTAEVLTPGKNPHQLYWTNNARHSLSVHDLHADLDPESNTEKCERFLRHAQSEQNIGLIGVNDNVKFHLQGKDVDCTMVDVLKPRTKFDATNSNVCGIKFKSNGELLVSDAANHNVKSFDVNTGQLKVDCSLPEGQGKLSCPSGLTELSNGQIVVADKRQGNLKVFTEEGRFLTTFGKDLAQPCSVTSLSNGFIVVCDEIKQKIYIFQNLSDKGVLDTTKEFVKDGRFQIGTPKGVTCLSSGHHFAFTDNTTNSVYTADATVPRIIDVYHRDDLDPVAAEVAQTSNYIKPSLLRPTEITREYHGNQVLIADTGNARIVRLEIDRNTLMRQIICTPNDGQVQSQGLDVTSPHLIASGPCGTLAVVDSVQEVIKIYRYME